MKEINETFVRKLQAKKILNGIKNDNIEDYYNQRFEVFLFQNSDKVTINNIDYGTSNNDLIKRSLFMIHNEDGESNIKTASGCNTRGTFHLTELDFIENELLQFEGLVFDDPIQKTQLKLYLNFIENKKTPQPKTNFTNTPQQHNINNQLQKEINDFSFFQINVVGNIEVDGKIYENIIQRNNDSIITPENWNENKLEFFNQRMSIYEDSFSQPEKIDLEIKKLNKEDFETDEHTILKKRYLVLLNDILNNETQESKIKKIKPKLCINQIALKYVYEYSTITRNNGDKIAKEYGHNSGEKLFQRFSFYSSIANRNAEPNGCTPTLLKNKIDLIKSVIDILTIDKQETAKNDVSKLESIYNDKYR
jgi:hypothetical protein